MAEYNVTMPLYGTFATEEQEWSEMLFLFIFHLVARNAIWNTSAERKRFMLLSHPVAFLHELLHSQFNNIWNEKLRNMVNIQLSASVFMLLRNASWHMVWVPLDRAPSRISFGPTKEKYNLSKILLRSRSQPLPIYHCWICRRLELLGCITATELIST